MKTATRMLTVLFVCLTAISTATARPKDDFTWMRGANYVPSYARNDVQTWMDYDPAVIDRELGYAEKMRLNTVRVFLQYAVYEKDPKQFIEHFESFLTLCEKHHIRMMPVLFDSCFGAFPDLEKYKNLDWMANPGQNRLDKSAWPKLEKYVRDVVGGHKNDPRIAIWDVMNEPFMTSFNSETGHKIISEFLGHFCSYVKEQNAIQPTCAGFAFSGETREWADKVDVLCFHNYAAADGLRNDIKAMKEFAAKLDKTVIINEVVMRPQQTFASAMPVLEQEKIGWCFWELMLGKTQFSRGDNPIQGIVYPDGSCKDPTEVAAVVGVLSPTSKEADSGWTLWTGDGPRGCKLRYANKAGTAMELKFYGTGVSLVHKVGPDCGIAQVLIDGRPATKTNSCLLEADRDGSAVLNTYSTDVDWNHESKIVSGLPTGAHTLRVIVTGKKAEASTDAYVQIVGLNVEER